MADENILGAHVTIDSDGIEQGSQKYIDTLDKMEDKTVELGDTAEKTSEEINRSLGNIKVPQSIFDTIEKLGESRNKLTELFKSATKAYDDVKTAPKLDSASLEELQQRASKLDSALTAMNTAEGESIALYSQYEDVVNSLTQKLSELQKVYDVLKTQGKETGEEGVVLSENIDRITSAILSARKEMERIDLKASKIGLQRNSVQSEYDTLKSQINQFQSPEDANTEEKTKSTVARFRELRAELSSLTVQYRMMSDEEKQSAEGQALAEHMEEIAREAAIVKDAIKDTTKEIGNKSSDTKELDSTIEGLGLVADGYGLATATAQLFGASTEDVQKAQARLQSIMVLSNSIQSIQNKLQKESAIMLGVARVQTTLKTVAENIHTAAVGKGVIATKAATAAQWLLNAAAEANPYVLLAIAIVSVVGALAMWAYNANKAEEAEKQLREELEYKKQLLSDLNDVQKEAGNNTIEEITKIRKLHDALKDANVSYNEKRKALIELQKIVPEYHGALTNEGVLINDNADALATYIINLQKVAYAQAIFDKLVEVQKRKLDADIKVKQKETNINAVNRQIEQLKTNGQDTVVQSWTDSQGKKHEMTFDTEEMSKQRVALKQWNGQLETAVNEAKRAESEIKMLEQMIMKDGDSLIEALTTSSTTDKPKMPKNNIVRSSKTTEDEYELKLTYLQKTYKNLLDSMEEGTKQYYDTRVALLETEAKLEQLKLKKEYEEKKANIEDKAALDKEYNSLRLSTEQKYSNAILEVKEEHQKKEDASMHSYLKLYGTEKQKQLEIEKDFDQKIANAKTEGERLILGKERQQALNDLFLDSLKSSIDWESVFGDLESVSTEKLQGIREQLKATFNSGNLDVEAYKEIGDAIQKIEETLSNRKSSWADIFKNAVPELEKMKQLQEDAINAAKTLEAQQMRLNAMFSQSDTLVGRFNTIAASNGITTPITASTSQADVEGVINSIDNSLVADTLMQIWEAIKALNPQIANQSGIVSETKKRSDKADEAQKVYKDDFTNKLNGAIGVADMVNANVQSLPELMNTLGVDENSGLAKSVQSFADSSAHVTAGMKDLASGNFVGALNNAVLAVGSLTDAVGITGESDPHLLEDLERLSETNEQLRLAIDNLTTEMSGADFSKVGDIYEQGIKNLQELQKNTQEQMARSAAAFKTGVSGKHSSNKKIDDTLNSNDWAAVSSAAGISVNSSGDFWKLTSEQMYQVATYATAQYNKIKRAADDGYRDAAQFMDDYIGIWQDLDEFTDAWYDKTTGYTFDEMKQNFRSLIADMDAGISQFTENFDDMVRNIILDQLISDNEFTNALKAWQEKFANSVESGTKLSVEEKQALYDEGKQLYQGLLDARNQQYKELGVDSTSVNYEAARKSVANISQDTGDAIVGRITAIDYTNTLQLGQLTEQTSILQTIDADLHYITEYQRLQQEYVSEIRDIQLESVGLLNNIDKNTRNLYDMKDSLSKIERKVNNL